ncbi:MAG: class I SAM-dependent methyltransferase [Omnitrophica WOR_2 bacterium]
MSSFTMAGTPDARATAQARSRYQRRALFYDLMEGMQDKQYQEWRRRLWSLARGPKVLEVGVGTGKNIPFYPSSLKITAIDLAPAMLERAQKRAEKLGVKVDLRLGDAQELDFPDGTFDTAVATCVFCSVPDPILGMKELRRVVKPGGQILLLEHVPSSDPTIRKIVDIINPLVVRMMGSNINRNTIENIQKAGLNIDRDEDLRHGRLMIHKLIVAHAPNFRDHRLSTLNNVRLNT